jgi:putative peptide zinc metalloprotease protein
MNDVMVTGPSETVTGAGDERDAVSRDTAQLESSTSSNEVELRTAVPRLAAGTRLLGAYQGSGFATESYLLGRSDGRMLMVSPVVYAAASRIDGRRTIAEVAEQVSADLGRRLDPTGLAYLIEAKLRPLGVVAGDEEAPPPKAGPAPLLSLGLRGTIVPPRVVAILGKILAPLFFAPVVVVVMLGFGLVDVELLAHHSVTGSLVGVLTHPALLLAMFGIYLAAALFHELGHAAACSYGGARPGRIGMGVYVLIPAFFTNVNDSYRLSRLARLRVDLGGLYFSAVFVLASGTYAWRTGSSLALVATLFIQIGMLQQLLPFGRLDGYFAMSDLVGVPDLFNLIVPSLRVTRRRDRGAHSIKSKNKQIKQNTAYQAKLRPKVKLFVRAWAFTVVPLLCLLLGMFVWRLPTLADASWHGSLRELTAMWNGIVTLRVVEVLLAVIGFLVLVLPFAGMTLLASRMLMLFVSRARRRLGRPSPSPSARQSWSFAIGPWSFAMGRNPGGRYKPGHMFVE